MYSIFSQWSFLLWLLGVKELLHPFRGEADPEQEINVRPLKRVRANVYLRQNNNNPGSEPSFRTSLVQREKNTTGESVKDAGSTTSKREREKRKRDSRCRRRRVCLNACSFDVYIHARICLRVLFRALLPARAYRSRGFIDDERRRGEHPMLRGK